jgi:hypothetical protein
VRRKEDGGEGTERELQQWQSYQGNGTEANVQHSVCFPLHSLERNICRRLDNTIGHQIELYLKMGVPSSTRLNLTTVHRTLWLASHRLLILIDSSHILRTVYKGSLTLVDSYVLGATEENHKFRLNSTYANR